jgi:hypothetical protein
MTRHLRRLVTRSAVRPAVARCCTALLGRAALLGCTALLALALAFAASPACAKGPVPFKGRGTATWDNVFFALAAPPAHFAGVANVSHLGNITQTGTLTLQAPTAPHIFPGSGSVTFVAANGDTVTFSYQGTLNDVTGKGVGTFTFTSGTGRFTGVTGGGTFSALIDLTVPIGQSMTVALDGKIDY